MEGVNAETIKCKARQGNATQGREGKKAQGTGWCDMERSSYPLPSKRDKGTAPASRSYG